MKQLFSLSLKSKLAQYIKRALKNPSSTNYAVFWNQEPKKKRIIEAGFFPKSSSIML